MREYKNFLGIERSFKIELALFLILGFLLGIVIKAEAVKRVTIGFEDYKVLTYSQGYDLDQMEKDLIEKERNQDVKSQDTGNVSGACGV